MADQVKVIEAQMFKLVDMQGNPRAVLTFGQTADPVLEFYDKGGNVRASLSFTEYGEPAFELNNAAGNARFTVGISPGEQPHLTLSNNDQPALLMWIDDDGTPSAAGIGPNGETVWTAP